MTDSKDRALEIHEITFDARDSHALAAFWGALLEREIRPGDMPQDDSVLVMPTPGQPGLLFLRVPEGSWNGAITSPSPARPASASASTLINF